MAKKNYNYRIIRIEKDDKGKEKKITMKKFFAENDSDAYSYLKKYRNIANKKYTYYFDNMNTIRIVEDGKVHEYENILESFEAKRKHLPLWKKMLDSIKYTAWRWFIDIPEDICYFVRDVLYFIKHKQYYRASWNLDSYVLYTLEHNLEKLIKYKHGIAQCFIDKARLELHKDDKDFDLEEYNRTHMSSLSKDEEELAAKIQNDTYADIIKTIRLYNYYDGCGVSDNVVFDKMCDNDPKLSVPYVPGTYKKIDYNKLQNLHMKTWNKIWEQVRLYGQSFWD